ncbi:MAG: imelysin family protein [Leptospiraceae bacterium]|nr:imelysin family protein [Leptospiraceae bacterium]
MFKKTIFISILLITFAFSYCSKNAGDDSTTSRIMGLIHNQLNAFNFGLLLKNTSENFIYQNYISLETNVNSLKNLTDALPDSCGGDTARLVAIQNAWKSSFAILKNVEIIQIGPSGSYSTIDSWPINYIVNPPDTAQINATIAGADTINETYLSNKSDNENGFPTIEYLIFDNGSGSTNITNICNALTGRRKVYLQEAVNLLRTRVTRLTLNWNPTFSGNFTTILQTAGPTNEFYKSEKEAVDTLIKQMVSMVEKIKDDKIGYPAGFSVESAGVVTPTNVETRFSNTSITAIGNNLSGISAFYTGNGGVGFSDYVRYYNISLDERVRAKIKETQSKATEILDLKGDLIAGTNTKVRELHTLLNELKILFTVELAGNLGSSFTPGLGDGDGD